MSLLGLCGTKQESIYLYSIASVVGLKTLLGGVFETRSTDQYEVQHPLRDEKIYIYLVRLCLACVELSRNQITV